MTANELETLRQALAEDPNSADLHYRMGVLYESLGEGQLAVQHLEKAVGLVPADVYPTVALAQMHARLDQKEQAIRWLERAVQLGGGSAEILDAVASCYHELYLYKEAIATYKLVVALVPDSLETHYSLGILCLQLGDLEQAVKSLEAIVSGGVKDNPDVWLYLAQAQQRSGNLRPAAECFEKVIRLGRYDASTCVVLGTLYDHMGRTPEAVQCFSKALESNPDDHKARFALARAQLSSGDTAGAHAAFRAALSVLPNRLESHLFQGLTYFAARAFDRAIGEFEAALQMDSNHLDAHSLSGRCSLELNNVAEALASLKKAVGLCPGHVSSLCGIGQVFVARGQAPVGMDFFGQALQVNPGYRPALSALEALYADHEMLVLDTLEEVLDALPDKLAIRGRVVTTWTQLLENFELTTQIMGRFVSRHPGDLALKGQAGLYIRRAYSLHGEGNREEAMTLLKQLLKIQPQNQEAQNALRGFAAQQSAEQQAELLAEAEANAEAAAAAPRPVSEAEDARNLSQLLAWWQDPIANALPGQAAAPR